MYAIVNTLLLQLVKIFRAAGAIPIAKTNVPQVSFVLFHLFDSESNTTIKDHVVFRVQQPSLGLHD
jgi:hypothetical protein